MSGQVARAVWHWEAYGFARLAFAFLAIFALVLPAAAADDEDKGPFADFYSYLPAAPDIKLPEISIPFWTDDLKKAKRAYRNGNYDRAVPTKLVEAMAMGRPVVASDLPRMAAIVRSTGCGIVVPHDDPAAHAAAIRELLENPALAREMGEAGRRAFLEGLTFEREARALTSFYSEVLG